MSFSVLESTLAVASSNISMGWFLRRARAMESRCFSPPDSFTPRSPTLVSSCLGRALTYCAAFAASRAFQSSSSVAFRLPRIMFSLTVPLNKNASWVT